MRKQVLVIGLGQFGMSVVQSLGNFDTDVLAVDRRPELVDLAAPLAAEAICLDATDEAAISKLSPQTRDVCLCAIGNEAREASFICTALLRQTGAKRILARATDPLHERILHLVGADKVVNPEREFGMQVAAHMVHEGVLGEYQLAEGVAITELEIPKVFVGKTMIELELPKRRGMTIIAIQRAGTTIVAPNPAEPLHQGDILVVVAKSGVVADLLEKVS